MLRNILKLPIAVSVIFVFFSGCHPADTKVSVPPQGEVLYHVFERSFYDSNGDLNGDFNGLKEKLDYLQQLGVTSLLLTPIVQSVYYHNYFADDFEKTDSTYGSMQDWISLVEAVHRHGMKIYLDQEFQYVTLRQKWFRDSYHHPASVFSRYLIYHDSANADPEPIIYNISNLEGYNDSTRRVATVNLYNPDVQAYFFKLLKYWMDPNGDGRFEDGVDGFRLDHMMDDLDNKGVLTHLFSRFWCPLITKLKEVNPKVIFIAEQANWADFGTDYLTQGCVDGVFAFNLRNAIASFDKKILQNMADSTFSLTPNGKRQIVFIENHDMERFASLVHHDAGKLRVAAALNLLIGGVPSVYYGQELGMFGQVGFGRFGNTDGNDIPQREAFEWYQSDSGNGMAIWYKNTGPWWDSTNLIPDDGISLQEEENDPHSLWNFYKTMIHLHTSSLALSQGKYATLDNNNGRVFSFARYAGDTAVLVAVNLSDSTQKTEVDLTRKIIAWKEGDKLESLYGDGTPVVSSEKLSFQLPAYGIRIWKKDN